MRRTAAKTKITTGKGSSVEPPIETAVIALSFFGVGIMLQQDAAVGAAFGSAFFMVSATDHRTLARLLYTIISAGSGYATGLAFSGHWSMLAAIIGAAGAVMFLEGLMQGGEPNGFIKWLADVIRGRR